MPIRHRQQSGADDGLFRWDVAPTGYRCLTTPWEGEAPPRRPHETRGALRAGEAVTVLTDGRPLQRAVVDGRWYTPLVDEPALFVRFADQAPGPTGIEAFAT